MTKAKRDIKRKLTVLNHYQKTGNVAKTCRHFGISRASTWKMQLHFHVLSIDCCFM